MLSIMGIELGFVSKEILFYLINPGSFSICEPIKDNTIIPISIKDRAVI
jgi:hypothetical protein